MLARSILVLVAGLVLAADPEVSAETIRLATGEVLIGEVQSADFMQLTVKVVFPSDRELTLTAAQLAPQTLYAVLAARLSASEPGPRLELAEYCLRTGLYAHAIVEARRVGKLDESKLTRTKAIESSAWEAIATTLLDEAKTQIAIEEPGLARMYLESLLARYPDTDSAKEAKRLLKKLPSREETVLPPRITDAKEKDDLRAKLKKAKKYYEKAEERTQGMKRHFQSGKKDEQLLRRAEPYYRKAYALVRTAARTSTDDTTLDAELRALAATVRPQLAKVYLELGSMYLGRGSIKLAEEYCTRACQVEPENRELHGLHQKILDARIALRYGT